MNWKTLIRFILPMIETAGQDYVDKDENDVGQDDAIGQSLLFIPKLLRAILENKPLPKAPAVLR